MAHIAAPTGNLIKAIPLFDHRRTIARVRAALTEYDDAPDVYVWLDDLDRRLTDVRLAVTIREIRTLERLHAGGDWLPPSEAREELAALLDVQPWAVGA
jgi:hypothetical protein